MMSTVSLTTCALALTLGRVLAAPAPTVTIAPGVELPMVVLGTGSGQHGDVANATATWLSESGGGVGIDTAYDYEDEGEIAKGIAGLPRGPPSALFIETKIPCSTYAIAKLNIAYNLQQLQMKSVDLMLIHFQCRGKGSIADTWRALEDALSAGQTRAIGVSNFNASELAALLETAAVTPAVNQCKLSVGAHDDVTIAFCKAHAIQYEAYSPLKGGEMSLPAVKKIGASHGKSGAQVVLRWIVQRGHLLATSSDDAAYDREDLELFDWTLTAAEMATLSAITI